MFPSNAIWEVALTGVGGADKLVPFQLFASKRIRRSPVAK